MEFFVMAEECKIIEMKQKLYEKGIPYQIKTVNNTLRIPFHCLQNRERKNYYRILVKEEYAKEAREVLKQCGV